MVVTVSHHFFFDKQDVHDENDDDDDDDDNDNGDDDNDTDGDDDDNDTDDDDDDNAVLTSLPKTFTSVRSMFISLPNNIRPQIVCTIASHWNQMIAANSTCCIQFIG